MAKRITKLTIEQEAKLPAFREEWLQRGLATGECDHKAVEEGARKVYEAAGIEFPQITIWMSSPFGGAFAAALILGAASEGSNKEVDQLRGQLGDQLGGQLWDQLGDQLWDQLGGQLWDQLRGQLGDQLRDQLGGQLGDQLRGQLGDQLRDQLGGQLGDQLWDQLGGQLGDQLGGQLGGQLWDQLWDQLGGQLWDQLWDQLGGQLGDQLGGQLGGQLWDQLWDQLGGQLGGQLGDQLWDQLWGQLWDQLRGLMYSVAAGRWSYAFTGSMFSWWTAWASFIRDELGAEVDSKLSNWLDGHIALNEGGWWFPMPGYVVFTERPTQLLRDAQGRLHNERGPAIMYADGWGIWAVHGVRVSEQIVERPHELTIEQILGEANAEIRRVMCERYGWDRFVVDADLKLLDECPDPANDPNTIRLYDLPDQFQVFGTRVRLITVVNASPERDGTIRRFGLTVPHEKSKALDAAAWTFGTDAKTYKTLARAT